MGMTTRPLYRPHDKPTTRSWLFLGENGGPCDQHCELCYYAHQKQKRFFHLDTLMGMANVHRHYYGMTATDVSGGEPTILPGIEPLVGHCARIGLAPTIITHGQNSTAELVQRLEGAGLNDWLVSIHGMGAGHDATVGRPGAWHEVIGHLNNYRRPVRINTTMTTHNMRELPALGMNLVKLLPPTVWNLIAFNPFYDWQGKEQIDFQAQLSTLAPWIGEAISVAEKAGWEVNVRYFPFCLAAAHEFARNCIGFYQTQYDPHEWALEVTEHVPLGAVKQHGVEGVRRLICDRIAAARSNAKCAACRFRPICEGPAEQYQQRYSLDELLPIGGEPVIDPLYFEKGGMYD
jgi:sulfatase maturation enzyme AslB (radical SAM superfamily)